MSTPPADPITEHATEGQDCGEVILSPSSTLAVLSRLPRSLWNFTAPAQEVQPELLATDVVRDDTIFGPYGSDDVHPQWEIARNLRVLKDDFLTAWRQVEADQLAWGDATVSAGLVTGEGQFARGVDLDRWVEQHGIGRPDGFTDCCLWRLLLLLFFQPGNTAWLMQEIAQLYTGERPGVTLGVSLINLTWSAPATKDAGCWAEDTDSPAPYDGYWDVTPWYESAGSPLPGVSSLDSYWFLDTDGVHEVDDALVDSFWFAPLTTQTIGLSLENAIAFVTPAGVHVNFYTNYADGNGLVKGTPVWGWAGCTGATWRSSSTERGYWARD